MPKSMNLSRHGQTQTTKQKVGHIPVRFTLHGKDSKKHPCPFVWIDAVEFSTTVDGNAAKTNDIRENLKLLMDNMSDANFHGQNVQRKPTREFIYKALETAIVWNTENMGMPFNTHTKHPTCFKTPICDEETSEDAEGFQWVNEQTKARLRALARAGGTMGYLDVQYGIEHVKREAD